MRLVDLNVLLNALNEGAADHPRARDWLERSLNGGVPVGFSWLVLVGFIRIATGPMVEPHRLSVEAATDHVRAFLNRSSAYLLHPTDRHFDVLERLLRAAGTAGNLTNDAHLAALAIEHKATVVTFDADFDRFPGVRWERPA